MLTHRPIAAITTLLLTATPGVTNSAAKAVGQLQCEAVEFAVWQAPGTNSFTGDGSITAVRLRCQNTGKTPERLKRDDLILIDSGGEQFEQDKSNADFSTVFEGKQPVFIQKFLTIGPGQQLDIGATFAADYDRSVDKGLKLDIKGTQFTQAEVKAAAKREPTAPKSDAPVKLRSIEAAEAYVKARGITLDDKAEQATRGYMKTTMDPRTRKKTTKVGANKHFNYTVGAVRISILLFGSNSRSKKWGEITKGDILVNDRIGFIVSGGTAADRKRIVEALK